MSSSFSCSHLFPVANWYLLVHKAGPIILSDASIFHRQSESDWWKLKVHFKIVCPSHQYMVCRQKEPYLELKRWCIIRLVHNRLTYACYIKVKTVYVIYFSNTFSSSGVASLYFIRPLNGEGINLRLCWNFVSRSNFVSLIWRGRLLASNKRRWLLGHGCPTRHHRPRTTYCGT